MTHLSRDELLRLERTGWDSLCQSRGASFYGDLMTEDGLMVLVNGMVMDRDQVVTSLGEAPAWDSYTIDEARQVSMGDGASALVYRATARRGDEPEFTALMSSTYVTVNGRPRLALYQQTAVAT